MTGILDEATEIVGYQFDIDMEELSKVFEGTLGDFWAGNANWMRWGSYKMLRRALAETDEVVWRLNDEPFMKFEVVRAVYKGAN